MNANGRPSRPRGRSANGTPNNTNAPPPQADDETQNFLRISMFFWYNSSQTECQQRLARPDGMQPILREAPMQTVNEGEQVVVSGAVESLAAYDTNTCEWCLLMRMLTSP